MKSGREIKHETPWNTNLKFTTDFRFFNQVDNYSVLTRSIQETERQSRVELSLNFSLHLVLGFLILHTPRSCRQRPMSFPHPSIHFLITLDPLTTDPGMLIRLFPSVEYLSSRYKIIFMIKVGHFWPNKNVAVFIYTTCLPPPVMALVLVNSTHTQILEII